MRTSLAAALVGDALRYGHRHQPNQERILLTDAHPSIEAPLLTEQSQQIDGVALLIKDTGAKIEAGDEKGSQLSDLFQDDDGDIAQISEHQVILLEMGQDVRASFLIIAPIAAPAKGDPGLVEQIKNGLNA